MCLRSALQVYRLSIQERVLQIFFGGGNKNVAEEIPSSSSSTFLLLSSFPPNHHDLLSPHSLFNLYRSSIHSSIHLRIRTIPLQLFFLGTHPSRNASLPGLAALHPAPERSVDRGRSRTGSQVGEESAEKVFRVVELQEGRGGRWTGDGDFQGELNVSFSSSSGAFLERGRS